MLGWDPDLVDFELEADDVAMEVRRQVQGQEEVHQRNQQREHADFAIAARKNDEQERAREGDESDQRQNDGIPGVHVHRVPTASQAM